MTATDTSAPPPPPPNPEAAARTVHASKIYGSGETEVRALDDITVDFERGRFTAIMGPSGSGKSTLMNIVGCLDHPSDGEYWLEGEDVSEMDKDELAHIRNRRIGFVFQSYNLLARTSALKNVMLPMLYDYENEMSGEEQEDAAAAMLESVGLGDRVDHEPNEMSGGQRQRVAIARALINDPALILADEPTGNLDSRSGAEIMTILDDLSARGRTIVMVTHESEIAAHANRTIHLRDGLVETVVHNGHAVKEA